MRRVFDARLSSLQPLEDAQQRLHALADGLISPRADAHVLTGRAAPEIARIARDRNASLIVLGEHGEGMQKHIGLGGTAMKVLRDSPCPVLVVRREAQHPYRVALVASDFSDNRTCRASLELFPGASHILVHAYDVPFESRLRLSGVASELLETYAATERERARHGMNQLLAACDAAADHTVAAHVKMGHPVLALLEEIRAQQADVIVVGRQSEPALAQRLLGSVTQTLLHQAACDVLLVP